MKNNIHNSAFLFLLAAMFLLNTNAIGQSASSDMFLKIKASKQGDITGGVTEKGKEGTISVITCQNENLSPRDAASGQATGKRQHKPITIYKEIDKASPMLKTAFTTKENLSEVSLSFYKAGKTGATKRSYVIELKDVVISNLKSSTDDKGKTQEEISFTFQKIEWKYDEGAVEQQGASSQSKN